MSSLPTVSIGMPVHNGALYLSDAIEDFLGQTFSDFELIVSDNASTDESEAIVREAAERDKRVRYVRNETNIGALPNSNRTMELARGKYFCLAAHDDRHVPTFLAMLVAELEANAEAVLAYGACTLIDEKGNAFKNIPERSVHVSTDGCAVDYDQMLERKLSDTSAKRYHAVLQSNDVNSPIHGLFRRSVLDRIGGHHFHGSDRLIVAHAALLGPFAYVDEPLFSFRVHPESTLFLTREQWAKRETGEEQGASPLSALRTLGNFWRAVGQTELGAMQRLGAYAATLAYAARPTAIRRALLPGPDNYFGWKRWPSGRTVQGRAPLASSSSLKKTANSHA